MFDIILFGVIIAFFMFLRDRRKAIERYQEEIDDFKKWDSEEARYRIAGAIRRLNRLGKTDIDFGGIKLRDFSLSHFLKSSISSWWRSIAFRYFSRKNVTSSYRMPGSLSSAILIRMVAHFSRGVLVCQERSTIWFAESTVHENGWATEIAIPFKSISFAPESDTWGINFGRGIVRKQEFNLWSSHDRQDWPAYGGEVSGITDIEQGLGLDIVPSVSLNRNRDLVSRQNHSGFEHRLR